MTDRCQSGDAARAGAEVGARPNERLLAMLDGVAQALSGSVTHNTEIVVHDLLRPESSIVQIVNGHVSGRHVGQPIIAGPYGDVAFRELVGPRSSGLPNEIRQISNYTAYADNGRSLRSSSVVFYDEAGKPVAALCTNVDTSVVERLQSDLFGLFSPSQPATEPAPAKHVTLDELVSEIISTSIARSGAPVSRMSKAEKIAAVANMHERGLFLLRGAVELVAKHLKTTKFTIYNYLDEISSGRASQEGPKT